MKTKIDTFNLSAGYERRTNAVTIGRHALECERMMHNGRRVRLTWICRTDTRAATYPSFAAVAGAASIGYEGSFGQVARRFVRAILRG
jgi:hypothetical protein